MGNWLERAKHEIQKTAFRPTAKTDETPILAVLAVPRQRKSEILSDANPPATAEELPPRAWVVEEIRDGQKLQAMKICSAVLEDHLWVILDREFEPQDGSVIYYAEKLPILKTKSIEELRGIHKVKLAFPGCRIQEGPEGAEWN